MSADPRLAPLARWLFGWSFGVSVSEHPPTIEDCERAALAILIDADRNTEVAE